MVVKLPKVGDEGLTFYPLHQLQNENPTGVDISRKQDYLSQEDFQKAFGMNKEAFEKLKDWKKKDLRKKAGLF